MNEAPRFNLAHEVRRRLEDEINDGRLMPGDSLDERLLAKRFGVSRTPIREAIQQLAAQGLLRVISRQGVYVARMSIRELLAMFELQSELEGICARYAARRITGEQREQLCAVHERARRAVDSGDLTRYAQDNADLHEIIYQSSHNRYLAEQTRLIRRRTQIYRQNTFQREGRITASHDDHEKVVTAILAGNGEGAYLAMREHISEGGHGFAEFVSTLPDHLLESHEQAHPPAHPARNRLERRADPSAALRRKRAHRIVRGRAAGAESRK